MSCSSSGNELMPRAVCSEICLPKYRVARDWLNVCIPYFSWPVCIEE
jgi:hypothetical protein